jgi:hypothetical protein
VIALWSPVGAKQSAARNSRAYSHTHSGCGTVFHTHQYDSLRAASVPQARQVELADVLEESVADLFDNELFRQLACGSASVRRTAYRCGITGCSCDCAWPQDGLGWVLLLPEYASFAACCSDGSTPSPSRTCGAAFTIQLQRSTVVSILSAAVQY